MKAPGWDAGSAEIEFILGLSVGSEGREVLHIDGGMVLSHDLTFQRISCMGKVLARYFACVWDCPRAHLEERNLGMKK